MAEKTKTKLMSFIADSVRSMQHKCRYVKNASNLYPYKWCAMQFNCRQNPE